MIKGKNRYFALLCALAALPATSAHALSLEVPAEPGRNLELTLRAIDSAKRSLRVNIYQLSAAPIVAALKSKIEAGLDVQILEEGQPVGGLAAIEKSARDDLAAAFRANGRGFLREMTNAGGVKRRFHFDHAKYVVADNATLLIGSENYTDTGNPDGEATGNRGWEVIAHDADLAGQFLALFKNDSDESFGDVLDIAGHDLGDSLRELFAGVFQIPNFSAAGVSPAALPPPRLLQADSSEQIVSPTSSEEDIRGLLQSARQSIDLEQMTFAATWDRGANDSPFLSDVLDAARRGVSVRVLLNDERAFGPPKGGKATPNQITAQRLNAAARAEGLPLEARIANVQRMGVTYIHNKGALVDGHRTLVSSINWNQNSVKENREAAVVVEGSEPFGYHEALFQKDWLASAP